MKYWEILDMKEMKDLYTENYKNVPLFLQLFSKFDIMSK